MNRAPTLRFTATPAPDGAPVAFTEYRLGEGAWQQGGSVTVTVQGQAIVWYRSVDTVGNGENARQCTVKLDFGAPRVTGCGNPACRRGGKARFTFKVTDAGASTVAAKLVVTRKGKMVRTVSLGARATGEKQTVAVKLRLRAGAYRWRVVALDAAGNQGVGSWRSVTIRR